jgi:hypothetical protein
MENTSNCLTMDWQRSNSEMADGESQRLDRNPDRMVWEDRLLALQFELEELDRDIHEGELVGAPAGSSLATGRGKILSRMEDLNWLIESCG